MAERVAQTAAAQTLPQQASRGVEMRRVAIATRAASGTTMLVSAGLFAATGALPLAAAIATLGAANIGLAFANKKISERPPATGAMRTMIRALSVANIVLGAADYVVGMVATGGLLPIATMAYGIGAMATGVAGLVETSSSLHETQPVGANIQQSGPVSSAATASTAPGLAGADSRSATPAVHSAQMRFDDDEGLADVA
jgi:hypothetical protein